MQNFFEKLLNNLVIAAFIPSLVFSSLLFFFFFPASPMDMVSNFSSKYQNWGLLVLGASFTISVFLFYTREAIFLIYRGYYLPSEFSASENDKAQSLIKKISTKDEQMNNIYNLFPSDESIPLKERELIAELRNEKSDLEAEYMSNFPADNDILPTRLGNILRSSEIRVSKRYGLDPTILWTHLEQIIPERNLQRLDDSYNQLSLLINSSFLSFILFIILGLTFFIHPLNINSANNKYLIGAILSVVFGYLFYRSSLPIAKSYAQKYCMAFDLFRFEILRKACLQLPTTTQEEHDLWGLYCNLLKGKEFDENMNSINLNYCHPNNVEKNNSEN
jgi:hypothetical protein